MYIIYIYIHILGTHYITYKGPKSSPLRMIPTSVKLLKAHYHWLSLDTPNDDGMVFMYGFTHVKHVRSYINPKRY